LEEAGPSGRGRNLENDLSSAAGFSWKGADQGTKARGKGKAPASTPSHTFEEKNAGKTTVFMMVNMTTVVGVLLELIVCGSFGWFQGTGYSMEHQIEYY
jgi:hypothetical protein